MYKCTNQYLYYIVFLFMLKNIELSSSVSNTVSYKYVIRCTRRFTAGFCETQVRPVWTFVFQKQECVLRMGCPSSPRVNRFNKYDHCAKRCKVLVDLYTQILMNDTGILRSFAGSQRRGMEDEKSYLRMDTANTIYPEIYEDAQDMSHYDGDGKDPFKDLVPRNIDGDTDIHTFLDVVNDRHFD